MGNPLLDLFVSEATAAVPTSPWQQELMATVNPEKMKKQRIAQAVAQASQALATTPGDFISGLSAAATTGANSYITQRGMDDERRTAAMRQIQDAQERDKQMRLSRLQAALGLQRDADQDIYQRQRDAVSDRRWNIQQDRQAQRDEIEDQRYADEQAYKREQDQRNYELRKANYESLSQYRVDQIKVRAEKQAIKTQAGGDVERERRLLLDSVNRNLNEFAKALPSAYTEEDRRANDQLLAQKRAELEQAYGISLSTGEMSRMEGGTSPIPQPTQTPAPAPAPTTQAPATGKGDVAGGPPRINDKAAFDALPSGTEFIAPDGSIRKKP